MIVKVYLGDELLFEQNNAMRVGECFDIGVVQGHLRIKIEIEKGQE